MTIVSYLSLQCVRWSRAVMVKKNKITKENKKVCYSTHGFQLHSSERYLGDHWF